MSNYNDCLAIIKRKNTSDPEQEFLKQNLDSVSLENLPIGEPIIAILYQRYEELSVCIKYNAPVSTIILCGGMLEGILFGIAQQNNDRFMESSYAPKDKKKQVYPLENWKLSNLIDVAYDLKFLGDDAKKFSHVLREYRNYIHPYKQLNSQSVSNMDTADICVRVLNIAIKDLSKKQS